MKKKIEKAFELKSWNEIKTSDSWQIFKIMAEFVQAFETLSKLDLAYLFLVLQEPNQIILITNKPKK